ncbi:hypothetical protein SAMN04487996_12943 [Dyadobacter soli]|uniref:NigD-like protein n=1 Tax=Dyadobacter soli TaxID=659014 RepID=A0A1G7ZX99_9BACT|nr:hypothetical protein [Dyadobacter soli]SDH13304.1 hypothetical protein SAMN04487996_12943 [Dyadobacter soli]
MKQYLSYFAFAVLSLFASCDSTDVATINPDRYGVLKEGNYIIYDVREENYSAGKDTPDVSSWQEKDQVISLTKENANSTIALIARFKRSNDADYWTKVKEFTIVRSPDKLLTTIDNESFMSLVFPLNPNMKWNGNQYNNRDAEDYRYDAIDQPFSLAQQNFQNTLTVIERQDSSIINKYTGVKKYALDIGLIYDDQVSFEYCQTQECLNSDIRQVESGYHRIRTVKQFGSN